MRMKELAGRYFFLVAMLVGFGASRADAVPVTFKFQWNHQFLGPFVDAHYGWSTNHGFVHLCIHNSRHQPVEFYW